MNYYDAREISGEKGTSSGLWHYTAQNDGRIFPVGYCAQECVGHPTPEEAREHYRLYLLDSAQYDGMMQDEQRKCEVCKKWTQYYAYIPLAMTKHILCNEHCNRETLDTVMHRVGQIIAS